MRNGIEEKEWTAWQSCKIRLKLGQATWTLTYILNKCNQLLDYMLDDEAGKRLVQQIFEIWINPEIERRRTKVTTDDDSSVYAAQIIFDSELGKQIIRINDEVRVHIIGHAREGTHVGKQYELEKMIHDITSLRLSDKDDPYAVHISMIQFNKHWYVALDGRPNRRRIKEFYVAGKEFLDAATIDFQTNFYRVFVDNLYSAVELFAICQIYNVSGEKFQIKRGHKAIQHNYNKYVKIGNAQLEYDSALSSLARKRLSARYLQEQFELSKNEGEKFLKIGKQMELDAKREWA